MLPALEFGIFRFYNIIPLVFHSFFMDFGMPRGIPRYFEPYVPLTEPCSFFLGGAHYQILRMPVYPSFTPLLTYLRTCNCGYFSFIFQSLQVLFSEVTYPSMSTIFRKMGVRCWSLIVLHCPEELARKVCMFLLISLTYKLCINFVLQKKRISKYSLYPAVCDPYK